MNSLRLANKSILRTCALTASSLGQIADIAGQRDALAAEISKSLLAAAAASTISRSTSQGGNQLVRRARALIDRVADLARDDH